VKRNAHQCLSMFFVAAIMMSTASGGEIGHYSPGVANIRDMATPDPGFYVVVYNYGYSTNRINDGSGDKISTVTIGGGNGPGVTLNLDVNVSAYALAPAFIYVYPKKVLGAKYGAYVLPIFSNASINGLLSSATGAGRKASAGQFNVGDVFVQPLWLDWGGKKYDISLAYGFYAPSGKYAITNVSLPNGRSVAVESSDNTGLGFWTNQMQGAGYLYPWADKRMAIQNGFTWEIHRKKRGFDLTPGQNLTWNWGISQFLPLKKDSSVLLEVGPAGYSSFQVTNDTGAAARNPSLHDRVHAAGLQVGVASMKHPMGLTFHWFREFSAVDRFQGSSIGVTFSYKF
jgi:hypothetical protein